MTNIKIKETNYLNNISSEKNRNEENVPPPKHYVSEPQEASELIFQMHMMKDFL